MAKFPQELIRRHKERILLKDTADDDQRMGPHDVDYCVATELPQVVSADDRVVVAKPYVVYTRLELDHVVDMRSILNRPVHTATNTAPRKSSRGVTAGQPLKHPQHPILIEAAIRKVDFGVDPKLQLPTLLRGRRVDARGRQALQMVLTLRRVEDMNGLIAGLQPVLYEWKQHAVFFLVAVEKRTDVTGFAEMGPG